MFKLKSMTLNLSDVVILESRKTLITRCCKENHGHISHGKYFSKKKKIEALVSYAKELDEKPVI